MSKSSFISVFLVLVAVVLGLFPGQGMAQQVEIHVTGDTPWMLTADEVESFPKDEVYVAKGHVRITRGEEVIEANRVRVHSPTQTAEIQGDVVLSTADFKVMCQRLVLNFEHNIGKIYNGTVFFVQNHIYIYGDEIERTGPDTFVVFEGRATSCDGPNPSWTLTGEQVTVQREGYATARHAKFSTRHFPLLYLPWAKVPIRTQRQSGFLLPTISQSSRDGFTANLPFFWAATDSVDVTLYATYMSERGIEPTVEFRFNDWGGKGSFRASYLKDQSPPTIDYDTVDSQEQSERYWIRGMADLTTPNDVDLKMNLDLVSDPRYLDEFKSSVTGYDATKGLYQSEFGRDLADSLDPLRKSELAATKVHNRFLARGAVEYTDDLNDPNNLETVQRLPRVGLDTVRTRLGPMPLFLENATEYNFFYRKSDDASLLTEYGHRLDIHPRLFMPLMVADFLEVEPSVGFRETVYLPYGYENSVSDPQAEARNDQTKSRELPDASIKMSTNFYRVYDTGWDRVERIKHRIEPDVAFLYIPYKDQNDLPYFDQDDRIQEEQKIRYGLSNYLVGKVRRDPESTPGPSQGSGFSSVNQGLAETYSYQEYVRLGIHRAYDFVEAQRDPDDYDEGWPSEERRPNSPWELELEAKLNPYLWAQSSSNYDSYSRSFTKHSVEVEARDRRGDSFYVGYELNTDPFSFRERYGKDLEADEYEEIHYVMNLALNDEWNVSLDKRHSLRFQENIETVYSVNYHPQCWGLRFSYTNRPNDQAVAVFVSLLGLGEVGSYSYTTEKETTSTTSQSRSVQ